jgi:hypothetical protein
VVARDLPACGIGDRGGTRAGGESLYVVGPELLARNAELGEALHHVADLRAGVLAYRALDQARLVVREQPREIDEGFVAGLDLEELERADGGVAGAGAQLALVFDWRAAAPQVDVPG